MELEEDGALDAFDDLNNWGLSGEVAAAVVIDLLELAAARKVFGATR
jgi:hypothetical protein